jgi:hypothetical protein
MSNGQWHLRPLQKSFLKLPICSIIVASYQVASLIELKASSHLSLKAMASNLKLLSPATMKAFCLTRTQVKSRKDSKEDLPLTTESHLAPTTSLKMLNPRLLFTSRGWISRIS